ncbi:hypothetical protein [Kosmotoga pacifica]|uniref:Uncharacterized protein n=1 Tax=Kosmotoga pacifica TaxID=1330330 RepID=A0A0G2ZBR3_9BACT|nr:hypothetical protein [Kosmotoga pacifica]AKI96989.1 hypothetical protein IX53_03180 [Kosmotoga pacifica]
MLRVSSLVFILGALCSYLPLFTGNTYFSMVSFAVGITISLFIWYVLAINRDGHYKELLKSGIFEEPGMERKGLLLKRRAVPYVIAYTFSFTALQLSSMGAMKILMENAYVLSENTDTARLMEILGKEYTIYSAIFLVSLLLTAFLFYKLIDIIYNDEVKMQLLLAEKRRIPPIVPGTISVWTVVLFTMVSYGIFSWYFRYRLMMVQVLYNRFREKVEELEGKTLEKRSIREKELVQAVENAERIREKYTSTLGKFPTGDERKEIIASLFRDLGNVSRKDAGDILNTLLEKTLLTESEYKKLIKLLF